VNTGGYEIMIALEYIIAQHQEGDNSVAIKSRKVRQENPALVIRRSDGNVQWQLRGLAIGEEEAVEGVPRVTHIDFYIGMDDLAEQRDQFPESLGQVIENLDGVRFPVGTERPGGTQIRWRGALGRLDALNIAATIPPFRFQHNPDSRLILNIDRESSPYPITSDGGIQTTRELHFGIEHEFGVSVDRRLNTPRIELVLTEDQYSTALSWIDDALQRHL